jgi:hypothetical protein
MSLREQILLELVEHPDFGKLNSLFQTYDKFHRFCTYDYFRSLVEMEGIPMPEYHDTLKRMVERGKEQPPEKKRRYVIDLAIDYVGENSEFQFCELKKHISNKRGIYFEATSTIVRQLIENGYIERVGKGAYQRKAA